MEDECRAARGTGEVEKHVDRYDSGDAPAPAPIPTPPPTPPTPAPLPVPNSTLARNALIGFGALVGLVFFGAFMHSRRGHGGFRDYEYNVPP